MEEKKSIKRKFKKVMHILNPLAGKGTAKKIKESLSSSDYIYMSNSPSDASEFIKKACQENPDTCFTVYGGDGTVFKAVNALMESGCSDSASLKVVPVGSGNDFVRSFEGIKGEVEIDIMSFNGRYAANVINMGFDCSVVKRTTKIKKVPFIPGKLAYTFGVAGEILNKKPMNATVTITYADGSEEVLEDEFLLIACGNCQYYGGGFKAAPAAKYDDGLLDVAMVKNVSVPTFVGLVADYKKGSFVDNETGEVAKKFEKYVIYKKCVGLKVVGCGSVCADGEIFDENEVEIGIVPKAINIVID